MNRRALILLFLILTGCSHNLAKVRFSSPTARFLTPETVGKLGKGELSPINWTTSQKVSLFRADEYFLLFSDNEVILDKKAEVGNGRNLAVNGKVGLLRKLDFGVEYYYEAPAFLAFKFQFIGLPEQERAKGFKAAIASRYGYYRDKNVNWDSKNRGYFSRLWQKAYDIDLLAGYRLSPRYLTYLNVYFNTIFVRSELLSDAFMPYYVSGTSHDSGLLIGLKVTLEAGQFISLEIGSNNLKWKKGHYHQRDIVGMAVGVTFPPKADEW